MSVTVASAAAILAGGALSLWERPEYRCVATLRIQADADPAQFAQYRNELVDLAWSRATTASEDDPKPRPWFVEAPPGTNLLRLVVADTNRQAGLGYVRQLAEDFRKKIKSRAAAQRATPTEAERILAEPINTLEQRLSEARRRADAATAAVPPDDPHEHRDALLTRWQRLRSTFVETRRDLENAEDRVRRLRTEPIARAGLVSEAQRDQALQADAALQQDLRELAVNLVEVKRALVGIWQESADSLDQLVVATDDLLEVASPDSPGAVASGARPQLKSLVLGAEAYRDALTAFAGDWNRDFTILSRLQVDPLRADVLRSSQALRRRLSDFLFEGAKRLAEVREQVRAINEGPTDTARHHVFQSNLTRTFQIMQAAHHRFEFAVGTIETRQNFQLDAALTSARGLRRRSQERVREIHERLAAAAMEQARNRRARELAEAEQQREHMRTAVHRTVDEILALQQQLNENADLGENFLRALLETQRAADRWKLIEGSLRSTETRLRRLADRRIAAADSMDVTIVSCDARDKSVNLGRRLRLGGIGAVLTLLTVLLGQWWVSRRS